MVVWYENFGRVSQEPEPSLAWPYQPVIYRSTQFQLPLGWSRDLLVRRIPPNVCWTTAQRPEHGQSIGVRGSSKDGGRLGAARGSVLDQP